MLFLPLFPSLHLAAVGWRPPSSKHPLLFCLPLQVSLFDQISYLRSDGLAPLSCHSVPSLPGLPADGWEGSRICRTSCLTGARSLMWSRASLVSQCLRSPLSESGFGDGEAWRPHLTDDTQPQYFNAVIVTDLCT